MSPVLFWHPLQETEISLRSPLTGTGSRCHPTSGRDLGRHRTLGPLHSSRGLSRSRHQKSPCLALSDFAACFLSTSVRPRSPGWAGLPPRSHTPGAPPGSSPGWTVPGSRPFCSRGACSQQSTPFGLKSKQASKNKTDDLNTQATRQKQKLIEKQSQNWISHTPTYWENEFSWCHTMNRHDHVESWWSHSVWDLANSTSNGIFYLYSPPFYPQTWKPGWYRLSQCQAVLFLINFGSPLTSGCPFTNSLEPFSVTVPYRQLLPMAYTTLSLCLISASCSLGK